MDGTFRNRRFGTPPCLHPILEPYRFVPIRTRETPVTIIRFPVERIP